MYEYIPEKSMSKVRHALDVVMISHHIWCNSECRHLNLLSKNTVWSRYNAVNIHERHLIARPSGRGMGCLLWAQPPIDILPHFLQWCVQCHVIFERVITTLDCILWLSIAAKMWWYSPKLSTSPSSGTYCQCLSVNLFVKKLTQPISFILKIKQKSYFNVFLNWILRYNCYRFIYRFMYIENSVTNTATFTSSVAKWVPSSCCWK